MLLVGSDATYVDDDFTAFGDAGGFGYPIAYQFTAAVSGAVDSLHVRVSADSSCTCESVYLAIYDDDGDTPGALLGSGNAVGTPALGATVDVAGLSIEVAAGTKYWLSALGISDGVDPSRLYIQVGFDPPGATETKQVTTQVTAPPDPWGTFDPDHTFADTTGAIWAEGTPTSDPTGLDFHITGLWHPDAVSVTYYGRIADPEGGNVRIPLNDSRTAKVTLRTTDPLVASVVGHAYARLLKVFYHGTLVFWGPISLIEAPGDGTVTFNAVDPSLRLIHHYVRRGDIDSRLGADTQDRAYVTVDHIGLRLLRDSGINTTEQTTRGVPDLGIADGTNDFPAADAADVMGVSRGDQTWEMMLQLSQTLGPDFELEPLDGVAGYYCSLNTYASQGTDKSTGVDAVQFHCGEGLDNVEKISWTEGSKYTTHDQVLDRDKKYRVTPANLAASADTGPYVDWDVTEYDVQGLSQTEAEAVLEQYGRDVLAAYSIPLVLPTLTLPVETADSFRYLRDFIVGDTIGAAGQDGYATLPEGGYRIAAVELTQEESAIRTTLEIVPPQNPDIDTEG